MSTDYNLRQLPPQRPPTSTSQQTNSTAALQLGSTYPELTTNRSTTHTTHEMAPPTFFITPGQQRQARACMVCSVVMTQDHFIKEGCPNCDDFLHLRGDREAVGECTSQVFEGVITLKEPTKSWVAKWLRLDGCVPGTYATKVSGILPDEIVDMMENEHKIRYIPRDGSEIQE